MKRNHFDDLRNSLCCFDVVNIAHLISRVRSVRKNVLFLIVYAFTSPLHFNREIKIYGHMFIYTSAHTYKITHVD